MNKLTMSSAELEKLKTQIRAQLNQIRFGPQKERNSQIQRSPSQRKHFERTYTHIFRDVFNPKLEETSGHHNYTEKKHYRDSQVTISPRNIMHQKKHYRQPLTDFAWTPKADKAPKVSRRKEMKQRSRSRSQGTLSPRLFKALKEQDKENRKVLTKRNATIYIKFY